MNLNLTKNRPFNVNLYSPWKDIKRVALKSDGTVYKYHDKNNTNLWEDGTETDWKQYEEDGLNCMVQIPKFYYKKNGFEETSNYDNGHIWGISNQKQDDYIVHPAFLRCRNKLCDDKSGTVKEVDYRYAPAFLGWKDSSGNLRSLPNKFPLTAITIGQARSYAKNNGNGWGILDYNLYFAIQLLYAIEYGDYDSQTALGRGYVDRNSDKTNTGGTLLNGNHSFGETTGHKQMSYRGIEDFWGNCYYWLDGFYSDKNYHMLIGNKGYNDTGNGYSDKGQGSIKRISRYIGQIQDNKECGFVIKSKDSGSPISKLYDFGRLYAGSLPIAGGAWTYGSYAGAFSFRCSCSASYASSYISASLAF